MTDSKLTTQDKEFLDKLTQIVLNNLSNEQFGVSDLSKEIGLNRSHLFRKVKLLKGQSVSQFINEIRLKEAFKLLKTGNFTASEVAYKVGFNNPSYFNNCFHEFYGFPPGEAKHQMSENPVTKIIGKKELERKKIWQNRYVQITASFFIIILLILAFYINRKPNLIDKEKSIAILPFDNLSLDKENQYFADGIVEDLLNRLSILDNLKVISRTSSEMFRDKGDKSVPEIAKILDVKYILEGSVQRQNNNVRINVQLIDAIKDNHILSRQYDRNIDDVFKLQNEIAEEIVTELSVIITDQQLTRLKSNQNTNIKAFTYYQIGHYNICRCSKEETYASIKYYRMALQEDSNYALAYAGLAEAYRVLVSDSYTNNRQAARDSALMYAMKALDIDNNLAEAHCALASIYMGIDYNMALAEEEFKKAVSLRPNNSYIYKEYTKF